MKHLLVAAAMVFAGSFANAADTNGEYFFQPKGGEKIVQGNFNYLMHSQDAKVGNGTSDFNDMDINATFEMGLSDMLAVYGNIGYGTGTAETTGNPDSDFDGIDPINLGVKYRMDMGPGEVFVRGNLGLGLLEDSKGDNRQDGSINLALRLGYQMNLDTALAGFSLDYGVFSTDGTVDATNADIEKKGYMALSAFYEMMMSDMVFGGVLTYSLDGAPAFGGNSPFSGQFGGKNGGLETSIVNVKAYTRIPMSEKMFLLGGLGYGHIIDQESANFDGGSNINVDLGFRMML